MKNFYKVTGIIAGIALGIGLLCMMVGVACGFFGTIFVTDNGFEVKDSTKRWQYTNMKESAFTSIDIDAEQAEIHIIQSENENYGVSFDLLGDEDDYVFTIKDGKLTIQDNSSTSKFAINIFSIGDMSADVIYISVPQDVQLSDINIDGNVGDIEVNIAGGAENIEISADVGEINVDNGTYTTMKLSADVGDIQVQDVNVTSYLSAEANVGEVNISGKLECDMKVTADVGSVTIETTCESTLYSYQVSADLGEVEVFGMDCSGADNEISGNSDGIYDMYVEASVGSVEIKSSAQ